MSHRYAVLWESSYSRARPVGLAVEQDGRVLVEVRDGLCVPRVYDAPFRVLGPDLTQVIYRPSDTQYFDHVLMDLSRVFTIGKEGRVSKATENVILGLLSDHVWPALRREHVHVYHSAPRTYPTVAAYQKRNYAEPAAAPDVPEVVSDARASTDSLVVA